MDTQSSWLVSSSLVKTTVNSSDIGRQLADARQAIIGGCVAAVVLLGMVVILHFWRGISFSALTYDPVAYTGAPAYVGAISHIGVMMWAATAAICLFTAWMIWSPDVERQDARFLACSGRSILVSTTQCCYTKESSRS